jgi:hypothetical protein
VWEKGVDAGNSLLRILGVQFVRRLAVLFRNSEDAQSLECFERVSGFRVEHADPDNKVIACVCDCSDRNEADENAFGESARRNHAFHPVLPSNLSTSAKIALHTVKRAIDLGEL